VISTVSGSAIVFVDYDRARIDPDPRGQLRVAGLLVELGDRVEKRKSCARSALGVVVVRRGPAEVSHQAVAEIFRHMAIKAAYRCGSRTMITRDRIAPLLGVKPGGDPGRADQVAEQHRQMPPLAGHVRRLKRRGRGKRNANWRSEGRAAFAAKVSGRRVFRTTLQAEAS
jgi:hypothetical protein